MSFYVDSFGEKDKVKWLDDLNLTPELGNIDIPVLLLWGADDGVVPATVGEYVYEYLATEPSSKRLVLIEECAHGPQHEQPEVFFDEITNFVELYK